MEHIYTKGWNLIIFHFSSPQHSRVARLKRPLREAACKTIFLSSKMIYNQESRLQNQKLAVEIDNKGLKENNSDGTKCTRADEYEWKRRDHHPPHHVPSLATLFQTSFYKVYRSLCKDNINIIMCQLIVLIYRMKRFPTYQSINQGVCVLFWFISFNRTKMILLFQNHHGLFRTLFHFKQNTSQMGLAIFNNKQG